MRILSLIINKYKYRETSKSEYELFKRSWQKIADFDTR